MGTGDKLELEELSKSIEKVTPRGTLLKFEGVGEKDVYNITAPFKIDGKTCIAGRVEPRENELNSNILFFEERNSTWHPIPDAPTFSLQDPSVTKVGDETVFGGVEVFPHPHMPYPQGLGYRTRFFRGTTLKSLEPFAVGPDMMKSIRILELSDGRIAVLTRPQAPWVNSAGLGRIGLAVISKLEELTPENITNAKIIPGLFDKNEWGGANELHRLDNGLIGVLGHIACAETGKDKSPIKHYQAMTFTLDPLTGAASPIQVIASRKDFPPGPAKRSPEHDDVIYPGGIIRLPNKKAIIYTGLSDAQAGSLPVADPFST